jgi:hypothetical protein
VYRSLEIRQEIEQKWRVPTPGKACTHESFAMSNWYPYQGALAEVTHDGRYFFARKDGFLIGTYSTLADALESLAWRERLKTK